MDTCVWMDSPFPPQHENAIGLDGTTLTAKRQEQPSPFSHVENADRANRDLVDIPFIPTYKNYHIPPD